MFVSLTNLGLWCLCSGKYLKNYYVQDKFIFSTDYQQNYNSTFGSFESLNAHTGYMWSIIYKWTLPVTTKTTRKTRFFSKKSKNVLCSTDFLNLGLLCLILTSKLVLMTNYVRQKTEFLSYANQWFRRILQGQKSPFFRQNRPKLTVFQWNKVAKEWKWQISSNRPETFSSVIFMSKGTLWKHRQLILWTSLHYERA